MRAAAAVPSLSSIAIYFLSAGSNKKYDAKAHKMAEWGGAKLWISNGAGV
ncbi:hypothetical protein [Bradyrhizobium commune]|uniref:Uncharacterized protein n=1 Tax=Bradyrhizobium commune TaxID=83627 RepID=A0A7S9H0X9_9BRAD|nr:hypothetical protein [Bradyrhizobium commune]QPF93089.1 hypothetical protein IC761_07410 [Bradyrhizobium commune]